MPIVRVGVIGTGQMGSWHCRSLLSGRIPGAELAAVCDLAEENMEAFKGQKHFTDPSALLKSKLVDAVLISTPHFSHTPLAIEAFKNGIHVLCEKPLAVHLADAKAMLAAQSGTGLKFGLMFQQRCQDSFIALKNLVSQGGLGPVTRVHWTVTDWFRSNAYY